MGLHFIRTVDPEYRYISSRAFRAQIWGTLSQEHSGLAPHLVLVGFRFLFRALLSKCGLGGQGSSGKQSHRCRCSFRNLCQRCQQGKGAAACVVGTAGGDEQTFAAERASGPAWARLVLMVQMVLRKNRNITYEVTVETVPFLNMEGILRSLY